MGDCGSTCMRSFLLMVQHTAGRAQSLQILRILLERFLTYVQTCLTASQIKIHFQPHPTLHRLPGAPPAPHQWLSTRKYEHSSGFSHHRLALPFLSFHINGILRWAPFHIWFCSLQIKSYHQHTDNDCGRRGGWVKLTVSSSCNKHQDCFYWVSLTGGRGKRGGLDQEFGTAAADGGKLTTRRRQRSCRAWKGYLGREEARRSPLIALDAQRGEGFVRL